MWDSGYRLERVFLGGLSPGGAEAEQGSSKFSSGGSCYHSNSGDSHHHAYSGGHPFSVLICPTQGTKVS